MYIYEIINKHTGKRYVGQTIRAPELRWRQHRSDLENQKHHNSELQEDFDQYGITAFQFGIITVLTTDADLNAIESDLIREGRAVGEMYNVVTPDTFHEWRTMVRKKKAKANVEDSTTVRNSVTFTDGETTFTCKVEELLPTCKKHGLSASGMRGLITGRWDDFEGWRLVK